MRLGTGKHIVEATGAALTESQSGTPGITFYFKNDDGDMECTRWVTEKTYEYVTKDLETLGFDRSLIADVANLDRIGEVIKGNQVEIICEEEEYRGKYEVKVKWINAIGGGKTAGGTTKTRLAALLSGKPAGLVSGPRSTQSADLDDSTAPF